MNSGARAEALFRDAFGGAAAACASAPGRVNIIGEHIDYHGGKVLPCAIGERTAVAVGPAAGLRGVSEHGPPVASGWPARPLGAWTDYVAGAAAVLGEGPWRGGLAIAVASDVPVGAGLSSSAALGVASVRALAEWAGVTLTATETALAAWRSETEFAGMPCGVMDQIAVTSAPAHHALLLDCRTLAAESIPLGVDLVVAQSGELHALRDSAYADRRREGEEALALLRQHSSTLEALVDIPPARLAAVTASLPPVLARRVKHVVNENQRTIMAAHALRRGDLAALGLLVNASHDSLRGLYECSTPRLDHIVDYARSVPRALGARLVGAGWGGSVLVVAEPGAGGVVADALRSSGLELPAVRVVIPGEGAMA